MGVTENSVAAEDMGTTAAVVDAVFDVNKGSVEEGMHKDMQENKSEVNLRKMTNEKVVVVAVAPTAPYSFRNSLKHAGDL